MSVTIKGSKLNYKDSQGNYVGVDVVAERSTEEIVGIVRSEGVSQVNAVSSAGSTAIANIQTKEDEALAQLANAAEVRDMIAGVFNTNTAYTAGQYVIQTVTVSGSSVNKLFRFKVDHAAGAWDDSEVIEVKLADDVADLKSALNETIESGFHIGKSETDTEITPTYTNGWLKPNGDVITSSAYHYTNKIHVQAGDVVKRLYGGDIEAVCAYDGNIPIESEGTNSAITSYTVPYGIDYVVLTIYSGYSGKILVITPLHELKIVTDDTIIDSVFKKTAKTVAGTSQGWRLNDADGLCATDQNYKLVKYAVTAGDIIIIQSDDRFQFQNSSSVPSSLPSNKIGMVYGEGLFCVKVPSGATYLIMSTPTAGIAAAYGSESVASSLAEEGSAWS